MTDPVATRLRAPREILISIPEEIESMGLSAEEYRIFFHLARRARTEDPWASVEFIAGHCRIQEAVVRTSLTRLKELKLASVSEDDGVVRGGRL